MSRSTDLPTTKVVRLLKVAFEELWAERPPADGTPYPQAVAEVAVRQIGGAKWASITRASAGRFWTEVATHETARLADELQYTYASGPCVDAIRDDSVHQLRDVHHAGRRWPDFAKRAGTDLGVGSVASCSMVVLPVEDGQAQSSLNVYSDIPKAFDDTAMRYVQTLARYGEFLALVTDDRYRIHHLRQALASNREIGIAIGMLMARRRVTREQAFDLLRIASQHTNRKLRDIATQVVDTGMLPSPPARSVDGEDTTVVP
ncbi:ANTAR domain-containing protein [Actinopolymorpha singaporensis]|uniref:ANTAR domain-containing protein n=1 Tax=Actinopolymorpha singaporensis TaxID=117157 RepID=A0A1H1MMT4_9ACTN|nr:ANTAR domain-containing protein [Actinopolymorpha singaporensis]SDR87695.1 ANTAR domain-containing protein [Actinopolymorpha singaporensis]